MPNLFRTTLLAAALSISSVCAEKPANPATDSSISLFNGEDLTGWETLEFGGSGTVEFFEGELLIDSGETMSGVVFTEPEKLPTMDYEVTLEAKCISGYDFFCALTFPFGDLETCATLVVGGWGGGVMGISCIDGKNASENNTTDYRKYEKDQWYSLRLRVTKTALQVWLDDEPIIDENIEGKEISLLSGSDIDLCAPFGLATFQTDAAMRNLVIRPLDNAEEDS